MKLRPYHVWPFLAVMAAMPLWRLAQRPRAEFVPTATKAAGWAKLAGAAPESFENGVGHRYAALAREVAGSEELGYFSDRDQGDLWAASSTPEGHDRIERYYSAQSILAPAILRFDRRRPRVVVDCVDGDQAESVLALNGLTLLRDFGGGLMLARPVGDSP